jgi:hypothetical protein
METVVCLSTAIFMEMRQLLALADKLPLPELEHRMARLEEGIEAVKARNLEQHVANTAYQARMGARIEALKAELLDESNAKQYEANRLKLIKLVELFESEKDQLKAVEMENKAYVITTDELKKFLRKIQAKRRNGL